jgi:hypothetical protein
MLIWMVGALLLIAFFVVTHYFPLFEE